MNKKYKVLLVIVCFVIIIIMGYPLLLRGMWSVLAIGSSSKIASDIHKNYQQYSSDKLIAMVKEFNNPYSFYYDSPYPYTALEVLTERKESKAVSTLINLLEMRDKNRRKAIIRTLGMISDPMAIEPLLRIANSNPIDYRYNGSDTPDNIEAMLALARMKYDAIYGRAVEIATRQDDPNDFRSYGIRMLEYFEKLESIPVLEKIATSDSKPYIRDKARTAIERLKLGRLLDS